MSEKCGGEENVAYGYRQVCCYGAYVRQFINLYIYPPLTVVNVLMNIALFRQLSKKIVEESYIGDYFWQPAYNLLRLINLNSCIYFLCKIPGIVYNIYSTSLGGTYAGASGYTLVFFSLILTVFGNDSAHWCNFILMAVLGIERIIRLNGSAKFTTRLTFYSYFLAIQVAVLKSSIAFGKYRIYNTNGRWHIYSSGDDVSRRHSINGGLIEDTLSLTIYLTEISCYLYICWWLLLHPLLYGRKQSQQQQQQQQQPVERTELLLTRIYLASASLFLLHAIFALFYFAYRNWLEPVDDVAACNITEILTETYNLLHHMSETSTAFMGFAMREGLLRAVFLNRCMMVQTRDSN